MSETQTAAVVGLASYFPDARQDFREKYEGTHMAVEVMVPIGWAPVLTLASTLDVVTPNGIQFKLGSSDV